jgi:hypothetical protein
MDEVILSYINGPLYPNPQNINEFSFEFIEDYFENVDSGIIPSSSFINLFNMCYLPQSNTNVLDLDIFNLRYSLLIEEYSFKYNDEMITPADFDIYTDNYTNLRNALFGQNDLVNLPHIFSQATHRRLHNVEPDANNLHVVSTDEMEINGGRFAKLKKATIKRCRTKPKPRKTKTVKKKNRKTR